jgi:ATP-dependent DNA helicase RecQ
MHLHDSSINSHCSNSNFPDARAWEYVQHTFQLVWGYSKLRPPQEAVIHSLLAQQDALIVMPTGGGKSICFQLPAILRTGLTLVVSPLVALMENQVQELLQRGLPAALLHSELPSHQRYHVLRQLERQQLRLLYLSPETLLSPAVWARLCDPRLVINGIILDEAHCLTQWGDTFRPAYARLGAVRPTLLNCKPPGSQMAIAAFTATADPNTQRTLQQVLQLKQPQTILLSPYRPNLHLGVDIAWTPRGRRQRMLRFIQAHSGASGLVYVRTRQASEDLALWCCQQGFQAAAYHAGLSAPQRRQVEAAWLDNRLQFVVCTSAFGMGINKPDVRWICHFHPPAQLSEYIQEVGRAGRDGQCSHALMLVSEPTGWLDAEDKQRQQFFQTQGRSHTQLAQKLLQTLPAEGSIQSVNRQFPNGAIALALLHFQGYLEWPDPFHYRLNRLNTRSPSPSQFIPDPSTAMEQYAHHRDCRWRFLLAAFGFESEAHEWQCGHCDRCQARRRSSQ